MQNSLTKLKTRETIGFIPRGKYLSAPLAVNPVVASMKLPVAQSSLPQV